MKISQLVKQSQISPRMLRYYEQQKLLTPERTEAGYRQYHQADIEQVKLIHQLSSAGLTLKTIKQILACWHTDTKNFAPCAIYKQNVQQTLQKIEQQIETLNQTRLRLMALLD